MKLIKNVALLFTLFCLGMLQGCSTTASIPLNPVDKQSIRTIKIVDVSGEGSQAKPEMSIVTRGQAMAETYGMLGVMVGASMEAAREQKIEHVTNENHIVINNIVKQQFIKQIAEKTHFKVVNTNKEDAVFEIKVKYYGLRSAAISFSQKLSPTLSLEASLVKDNKIIWREDCVVVPTKTSPAYYMDDYLKNPALLTEAWNAAAAEAVSKILQSM